MSQSIGQRDAFRRARENGLLSGSRNCGPVSDNFVSGNSLKIASENNAQMADRSMQSYNDLDQSGFDAQSMRTLRGIGTAFIAGVCVWTILFVVGYFLWVYRA